MFDPTIPVVPYYERNLPHWNPEDAAIFLTWRLHGTCDRFRFDRNAPDAGRAFVAFDRALDASAATGPKWLKDSAVAQCIVDALRFGELHLKLYTLIAFCVMPNHVHLVIEPHAPLPIITKSIKGFTARKCNVMVGRTGEPFWQDESYDRWIRNPEERNRIIRYVERNPVSAGLVEKSEQWPWSSASC